MTVGAGHEATVTSLGSHADGWATALNRQNGGAARVSAHCEVRSWASTTAGVVLNRNDASGVGSPVVIAPMARYPVPEAVNAPVSVIENRASSLSYVPSAVTTSLAVERSWTRYATEAPVNTRT